MNGDELEVPEVSYSAIIHMPSSGFQKIIRDLTGLSDRIKIESVGDDLIFSCEGQFSKSRIFRTEQRADSAILEDKMDSINVIEYIKSHKLKVNEVKTMQYGIFQKILELAPTREELKKHMKFVEIEPGDYPWFYLKDRLLQNKTDRFLYSPSDKRLAVLNLGPGNKVIGYQTRSLVKRKNSRYLTYDIERIYEEMDRELTAEPEEIAGMKKLSTLFGIMMVKRL